MFCFNRFNEQVDKNNTELKFFTYNEKPGKKVANRTSFYLKC